MLTVPRRLGGDRSALAGLEFALVVPVLLIGTAGVVDLSAAFITAQRLTVAAEDVALIASTTAVQSATLNALSGQQAWAATTAPFAIFPSWPTTSSPHFSVTLSAVDFTATPAGCSTQCSGYAAATRWSVGNPTGIVALRPCGGLTAVPDGDPTSLSTLPQGVFGPTSVLVGDVSTQFTPPLVGVFVGSFTLSRSAYIPPRINSAVQLTSIGPGQTVTCSGG